jgi:hypothetical protein
VRGRKVALFAVIRDTKEQAARAFCEFIHTKETKQ